MLYTCFNGHEYGLDNHRFSDLNDEKRCPVCAVDWAFVRVTTAEAMGTGATSVGRKDEARSNRS